MKINWLTTILIPGKAVYKDGLWVDESITAKKKYWSFSQEWKNHADTYQQKTWDWTAEQRLEQFYIEAGSSPDELKGKLVLDAGCGNGQLTTAMARAGAYAVGIDVQQHIPVNEKTDNPCFVWASFEQPPFKTSSFDFAIANGSLHHTKNTFASFNAVAELIKPGGKMYVWLYKKPDTAGKRFLLWWLDFNRFFISRFPLWLQKICVNVLTIFFFLLSRIRKGKNSKRTKEEIRINVYDAFTPRYRHYHTPVECAQWFFQCGFGNPVLSHWDNLYGFGMVATKERSFEKPAGENFI